MTTCKPWTMPDSYAGEVWPDYYTAGVGRSRDYSALERANFNAMLQALGGESETVIVVHEGHWAVGWIEWIAIHATEEQAIATATAICDKLEDYPVIDEELFGQYEDEDCAATWACYNERERAQYLRDHVHKVYVDSYWGTPYRQLRAAVKGDWGAAANLLPCPSDLLY